MKEIVHAQQPGRPAELGEPDGSKRRAGEKWKFDIPLPLIGYRD
jgi:hypothetical protein